MLEQAAAYVIKHEGFIATPVWDVNAWRVGYGSDTLTDSAGNFRKVLQTDTTTREAAKRDLIRRISTEFIPKIKNKIGADTWEKLTDNARVAFVSLAYNYGGVTKQAIIEAAKTGSARKLAEAWISSTYNDNKKLPERTREVLRKRRADEAALILSGGEASPTAKKIVPLALLALGVYLLTR